MNGTLGWMTKYPTNTMTPAMITADDKMVQIMAKIQIKGWVRRPGENPLGGMWIGARRETTFGKNVDDVFGILCFGFKVKNLVGFLGVIGGEGFGIFFSLFESICVGGWLVCRN